MNFALNTNSRKKIVIFSNLYYPNIIGGAEKVAQMLAENLLTTEYEPVVVSLVDKRTFSEEKVEYINNVKVYRLLLENIYFPFDTTSHHNFFTKVIWHINDSNNKKMGVKIKNIFAQEKPQIVCTHNLTGFSDVVWKIAKKDFNLPTVHVLHDHYQLCPWSSMFHDGRSCERQCLICKVASFQKKELSRYVDAVIGVSKYILHRHLEYGYFKNAAITKVIYNAVNNDDLLPKGKTKSGGDKLRIGYLGRLEYVKGIETLLQAINEFSKNEVELFVAGSGENSYVNYLKAKYSNDNIKYLGFIKPITLYKDIDLLIIPSLLNESFPLVAVQALVNSIPVIASKVGGIPEIVVDEINGFLFKPGDAIALEFLIRKFLQDSALVSKIGSNQILDLQPYSISGMISEYIKLFNQLTGSS